MSSNSTYSVPSTVGDTSDSSLDNLWRQSISNNTQTAYNTGLNLYIKFVFLPNDVILYIHSVPKHRVNTFQRQNYKMRLKQRSLN
jgi:hypothetical protein